MRGAHRVGRFRRAPGGFRWSPWLTTTLRAIYTTQGAIRGAHPPSSQIDPATGTIFVPEHVGPFDFPENYGGHFWDLGVGVNVTITRGEFAGTTLKAEWLQPLRDDVNGFQRERRGTLTLAWSAHF